MRLVRSPDTRRRLLHLTQGGASSVPEEDAIEITEGWRNSQWPNCMVTLPKAAAASAVDLKRMFDYAADNCWRHFKAKAVAAARASRLELRALFPREGESGKREGHATPAAPRR